ncbi:GIY-YIG nuclease family protein [Klebsiella pneumoniae]|uniref:GIY-YIG nuclease family protein n=1 Tax=Klebsiella pneumoniae TaxID=573 RepID=UPI003CFC21C7
MNNENTYGYVYILVSDKTPYIKIGGTDYLPEKRCKKINTQPPYCLYAPWRVADYRSVPDWHNVETWLHYLFRDSRVRTIANQKELFNVTPELAAHHLASLDQQPLTTKPKIDRLFHHQGLRDYLVKLFAIAGCEKWRHKEGVWVFSLFPGAHSGWSRYFTLSIHSHEVAFSTRSRDCQIHMLLADELIMDYPDIVRWVTDHKGGIEKPIYKTALSHAQQIWFEGEFEECLQLLSFPEVQLAVATYWDRALTKYDYSLQAKYHNRMAVEEIFKQLQVQRQRESSAM